MIGTNRLFCSLLMLLALGCAIGMARMAAITCLHVPLDPNEGWNAYHALAATSGGALYPPPGSLMFNNYPPLSFYIVGAFGLVAGDNIVAGRILSLLATLGVTAAIYACLRAMKTEPRHALFAALLFVSGLLVFTDYVGMDDPQLLAHAVALSGLVLLLARPATSAVVTTAALLMTAALFLKHNLIALPVAVTIWLALYDGRNASRFAILCMVFGLIGLAIFHQVYGDGLIGRLDSSRLWSAATLTENLTSFLIWADVSLFGLAVLIFVGRGDKRVAFCAIYAAISVIAGTTFAGGAGVDLNVWFDAAIALALGTGLLLEEFADRPWLNVPISLVCMFPLLAGLSLGWDDAWLARDYWLHPLAEETASARADIAFLRSHEGPALCEMLSLCYWAGKREEVDVFNLGQSYATNAQGDADLVLLLDRHYFLAIEFDSLENIARTSRVKLALLRDYRIDHADDNGVFLLPR